MAAFSPTIRKFGDVTSRQKPWTRWYRQHKGRILSALLIAVLAIGAAGLWWNWHGQYKPAPGGQLDEGIVGQPQRLNPLYSQANPVDSQITPLIFRSLLKYDQDQNLTTDLANQWVQSEDGKTHSITLGDHHWHDGHPVTTDDIVYTIKTTQDKAYTGSWSNSFTGVTINKKSEKSIDLVLDQPYAPFGQNLTIGLLPQHILSHVTAAELPSHSFNLKPVGTGPFKFDSLQTAANGQAVSLRLLLLDGYLDSLEFHFYEDAESMVNDFKLGKIQSFGSLPHPAMEQLDGLDKKQQSISLSGQSYGLYFNMQSEAVKDLKMRQALSHSLDKSSILSEALGQHWTDLTTVYNPSNWAHYDKLTTPSHDQAKAETLYNELKTKPQKISLIVVDTDSHRQVADGIQKSWSQLGLEVQILHRQGSALTQLLNSGNGYDVILLGEKVRQDPDRYSTWHSTQTPPNGLNISHLDNARIDRALVEGRTLITQDDRKVKYTTFQTLLNQELPVIWLYQPHYIYTWSNKVFDVTLPKLWDESDRYQNIQKWYVNQSKQ